MQGLYFVRLVLQRESRAGTEQRLVITIDLHFNLDVGAYLVSRSDTLLNKQPMTLEATRHSFSPRASRLQVPALLHIHTAAACYADSMDR